MNSRFSLIVKEFNNKISEMSLKFNSETLLIDLDCTICDFAIPESKNYNVLSKLTVSDRDRNRTFLIAYQFLGLWKAYKNKSGNMLPFFEAYMRASNLLLPRFSVDYLLPIDILNVLALSSLADNVDISDFSEHSDFAKDTMLKSRKISLLMELKIESEKLTTYYCDNLQDIVVALIYHTLKSDYIFKECGNCKKLFVPTTNRNEEFCDRISPQYSTKTCKAANVLMKSLEREKSSELKILEKKIYNLMRTSAVANENKVAAFDKFKREREIWRNDLKSGAKTEAQFISWLQSHYSDNPKKKGKKKL